MSVAAEHAQCNTSLNSTQLLGEGTQMMAHVEVNDRWEEGTPTPIPSDAKVRAHSEGGISDAFFAIVYVDDYLSIRV